MEIVGQSISMCVLAMAKREISADAVSGIVGGTAYQEPEKIFEKYSSSVWKGNKSLAKKIFFEFWDLNKIDQPRLRGEAPPDPSNGIWHLDGIPISTSEIMEIFDLSDYFLKMSIQKRNKLLEYLPEDVIKRFTRKVTNPKIKELFPNLPGLVNKVPTKELYAMVRARLKQFYRHADEVEKSVLHSSVLRILAPFLRAFRRSNPKPRLPFRLDEPMLSIYQFDDED